MIKFFDVRVLVCVKLVLLLFVVITLLPARGQVATLAADASRDVVLLATIAMVPAIVASLMTIAVLLITKRSEAKAKAADNKAAAEAKAEEIAVRRADKREDWARLDAQAVEVKAVAAQAKEAAGLLLARQEEDARLLKANNEVVAKTAADTQVALAQIHTLVNSRLTKANEMLLRTMQENLVLRLKVIEDDNQKGVKPSVESLAQIETLRTAISDLTVDNVDHARQTEIAAEQARQSGKENKTTRRTK